MAVKNPRESVAGNTQHSRRLSYVQTEWLQAVFANAAPRMGGLFIVMALPPANGSLSG